MRSPRTKFRLSESLRASDLQLSLMWAGVVGLTGASVSVLFRKLVQLAQELFWQQSGELVRAAQAIPSWQRLLVPALGGLLAGFVIGWGAKLAKGQTSTDFMEAVSLGDGTIPVRRSLVKCVGSLCSVASGGSIGREGAMVQLSSMVASALGRGRARRLPPPRLKLLVACGAAAGIASAYNAPLGGALFVAEIVLGSIAMESLGPLVFASVVSTLTTRQLLGPAPLFVIPQFHLVSPLELGPYLLLGVGLGALAPWFVRTLRASERWFVKLLPTVPARLCFGGLIVGALSIGRPEVWGNGNVSIGAILGAQWVWQTVLFVLICKLAATVATVGSGAVGGVFTPTLFVGAACGALFGGVVHTLMPDSSAGASAYALVGMGSFLAGTIHAPLTAILVLFEMTLDYGIVLPLMLACVVAYYTARAIDPSSVYSAVLARREDGVPHSIVAGDTIRPLVRSGTVTVPESASFAELVKVFVEHRHNYVYVVDSDRRFLGAVALHDLKAHMADTSLAHLIIASELMDPDFPFVEQDATVAEALQKLLLHDGERLPVVDGHGGRMLVGTLSKRDLLLTVEMRK